MKKISLILIISLCILTGCGKKEKEIVNEGLKINNFALETTKIESFISKDNKLIVKLENNSSSIVDFYDIDTAFYGENNELLKTGDAFLKNIAVESIGYALIDLPKDDNDNPIEPSRIDIKVHENKYEAKTTDNFLGKVEVSHIIDEKDKSKIDLKLTNSSNKKLNEVEVICILKENGEIVSIMSAYFIDVDKEAKTTVYIPSIIKDDVIDFITYDEIELHINHAIKNK